MWKLCSHPTVKSHEIRDEQIIGSDRLNKEHKNTHTTTVFSLDCGPLKRNQLFSVVWWILRPSGLKMHHTTF